MGPLPTTPNREQPAHFSAVIPFAVNGCQHLRLAISTTARGLSGVDYVHDEDLHSPVNELAKNVVQQLENYFEDSRWKFNVPLDLAGTSFQQRLWQSLTHVPVGQTNTYGHLAQQLNSGAQAVGQACRRNPVPVVVPCHRIVSRQGMGGYAGEVAGEKMRIKQALLSHEGFRFA